MQKTRGIHGLRRLGAAGIVFFTAKGLLWLALPLLARGLLA